MPRRRNDRERGALLVELALVVPFIILLLAGMIEVGAAWRDKSTAIQASRQAARVGSHLGQDPESDQEALLAALSVLPGGGNLSSSLEVRRIVIYNTVTTSDVELSSCKTTSGNGTPARCNVYSLANGRLNRTMIANDANFDDSPTAWDAMWPASGRDQSALNADEVGVYVEVYRPYLTDVFPGSGQKVTAFTVMRIEPES